MLRLSRSIVLACSWLLASVAAAQEPAPAQQAPAPAPAPLEARPARPAYVAPGAVEAAWHELHEIQMREPIAWEEHSHRGLGLPLTGILLGVPMFSVMIPIGSILVADSNYSNGYESYDDSHERRVGATLISFGILGLAAVVTGSYAIAKARRRRKAADEELRSLADRRALLERLIEAQWRSEHAPNAASLAP